MGLFHFNRGFIFGLGVGNAIFLENLFSQKNLLPLKFDLLFIAFLRSLNEGQFSFQRFHFILGVSNVVFLENLFC